MVKYTTLSRRNLIAALPFTLAACATPPVRMQDTPRQAYDVLADFPRAPVGPDLPTGPLNLIAVSSCSDETRPASLYTDMANLSPDLVLMLGDNVYGSGTPDDPALSDLRAAYWQMARRREFVELAAKVPVMAVWDDHDFGKNDAGGDFPHKALTQRMFNRFWNIPADSPLQSREGIYRTATIGPVGQRVQIIMLDTRYFRDPLVITDQRNAPGRERYVPHAADSNADVLGAAQWTWLEATLKQPADLRIIASSIQVIADGHGYERWGNFPKAQARLYKLIGDTGAKGIVFVSGDRHLGAINQRRDVAPYILTDLTASAINTSSWREGSATTSAEAGPHRLGPSYTPPNYGRIAIDWAGRNMRLEVVGFGNNIVLTHNLTFGALGVN